jgi:hypothetical protein
MKEKQKAKKAASAPTAEELAEKARIELEQLLAAEERSTASAGTAAAGGGGGSSSRRGSKKNKA